MLGQRPELLSTLGYMFGILHIHSYLNQSFHSKRQTFSQEGIALAPTKVAFSFLPSEWYLKTQRSSLKKVQMSGFALCLQGALTSNPGERDGLNWGKAETSVLTQQTAQAQHLYGATRGPWLGPESSDSALTAWHGIATVLTSGEHSSLARSLGDLPSQASQLLLVSSEKPSAVEPQFPREGRHPHPVLECQVEQSHNVSLQALRGNDTRVHSPGSTCH